MLIFRGVIKRQLKWKDIFYNFLVILGMGLSWNPLVQDMVMCTGKYDDFRKCFTLIV